MNNEMQNRKPKWVKFVWICVLAVVVTAAAVVGILFFPRTQKPSLERTLELIQPEFYELMNMFDQGGTFQLSTELSGDLLGGKGTPDQKLDIKAKIEDQKLSGLQILAGSSDNLLELLVMADKNGLTASSKQLFGDKVYTVTATEEALRGSVFNPEHGGEYAVPQELFDSWIRLLRNADRSPEAEFQETFDRLEQSLIETMRIQKATETVSLLDGERELKVIRMELDNDCFLALAQALKKEFEDYGLEEKLKGLLWTADSDDAPGFEELKKAIDAYIQSTDDALRVIVEYAENDGYIVYGNASLEYSDKVSNARSVTRMEWRTGSDLEKDPSYQLMWLFSANGEDVRLEVSGKKTGEGARQTVCLLDLPAGNGMRVKLEVTDTYQLSQDGTWTEDVVLSQGWNKDADPPSGIPLYELHAAGTLAREGGKLEWTLDTLRVTGTTATETAGELFTLENSSLRLEYDKEGTWDEIKGEPVDLMKADEKTIDDALQGLRKGLKAWADALPEQVRALWEKATLQEESRLTLPASVLMVTYDNSRDRLYVAERAADGSGCILKVYNGADMTLMAERQLPKEIVSMNADNGFLAYSFQEVPFGLYVLNGETLEDFKTYHPQKDGYVHPNDYISNIIVDGYVVFCTTKDQWVSYCLVDLQSNEDPVISPRYIGYRSVIAYDRANHTVASLDTGITRTDIFFLDLQNPDSQISLLVSDDVSSGQIYFNGITFSAEGKYYTAAGAPVSKEELLKNISADPNLVACEPVYMDSQIRILLEVYQDGTMATVVYTDRGVASYAWEGEVATAWIGGYNGELLLAVTDGTTQSIVRCSIIQE